MATDNQALKILVKSSKQILLLQIERLEQLSAKDFPYSTSKEIIKLMHVIFDQILESIKYLENQVETAKKDEEIKDIKTDLRLFTKFVFSQNETLNMLESSTREKVSQNTVFLIKYLTKIFPDSKFLVTAIFEHNFGITYWGKELQKAIKNMDVNINGYPKPESFFILSFPAVYKDNLVANSILGHELGHFIIQDKLLLIGTNKPEIKYNTKFFKELVDVKLKEVVKGAYIPKNVIEAETEQYYNEKIKGEVTFGIEEILSDLIGFRLFGPVMLFALSEFLLVDRPSFKIGRCGYPPPALRLRTLLEELDATGYISKIKDENLKKTLGTIVKSIDYFVKNDSKTIYDLEGQIKMDAWREIIPKLKKIANDNTKGMQYSQDDFGKDMPILIEKLADLTPPCEREQGIPANLISILNAGMIFRIAWNKLTKKDLKNIEPKIDSLVLRAAEQSIIASQFIEAFRKGQKEGL